MLAVSVLTTISSLQYFLINYLDFNCNFYFFLITLEFCFASITILKPQPLVSSPRFPISPSTIIISVIFRHFVIAIISTRYNYLFCDLLVFQWLLRQIFISMSARTIEQEQVTASDLRWHQTLLFRLPLSAFASKCAFYHLYCKLTTTSLSALFNLVIEINLKTFLSTFHSRLPSSNNQINLLFYDLCDSITFHQIHSANKKFKEPPFELCCCCCIFVEQSTSMVEM